MDIFHELDYDQSGTMILGGKGFFLDVLNILEERLNFTAKLIPSVDGYWGSKNMNGTWNGLVGMLIKKQADIAFALCITEERSRVITGSMPLAAQDMTLISARTMAPQTNAWIYLQIFPEYAWYAIAVMVIIIAICYTIINHSEKLMAI